MTIIMIQGPDDGGHAGNPADTIRAALSERAQSAGQELIHYRCASEQQLLDRLARIDRERADILLFDPGTCSRTGRELSCTLEGLQVPYIEVHGTSQAPGSTALPGHAARLAVIDGYAAQGYTLALSVALEALGCAECENDVHVGT